MAKQTRFNRILKNLQSLLQKLRVMISLQLIMVLLAFSSLTIAFLSYKSNKSKNLGNSDDPIYVINSDEKGKEESSNKNNKITKTSIGGVKIGMNLEDAQELYRDYDITSTYFEGLVWTIVKENKETILAFSSMENEKISGVMTSDPTFIMPNGLHVGSTLKEYFKIYPEFKELVWVENPSYGDYSLHPFDMNTQEISFSLEVELDQGQNMDESKLSSTYDLEYFYYKLDSLPIPTGRIVNIFMGVINR